MLSYFQYFNSVLTRWIGQEDLIGFLSSLKNRFDAAGKMLEKLRNRCLVFVGDSIGRNQWESLLCMLSSALPNKTSIYEVNVSPITKHLGFLVIKFEDLNCTAEYYRSPYLVIQGHAPVQKGDCYFQEGEEVKMNINIENAYRRSIETVVDWIGSEVNTSKTYVLFRTYAPVHFRGGDLEFWWGLSHGSFARVRFIACSYSPIVMTIFDVLSE
ncbi:hypothetical protein GBA52_028145 [Prunus armeniaca]|nr:hypothetical protein GBA52_028145 [Prunus armeniaca]